jgi:hypothetical protein
MNIETLLAQVNETARRYDEIAKLTGENFNIFTILDLSADELSHSRILAALLNPNGTHGKADTFLKLFLKRVNMDTNENLAKTRILREHSIGDYGRIDILIKHEKFIIVIENKIYAEDQPGQLLRYYKYLEKEKGNTEKRIALIYLTRDGVDASRESTGEKEFEYTRLSYRDDIIEWLEDCKKNSVDTPLLRETITQYINLLKRLTGQARSKQMAEDIVKIMANNVEGAFDIAGNLPALKKYIISKKLIPELKRIANERRWELTETLDAAFKERYKGFLFENPAWKYFSIKFEFQDKDFQNGIYGFVRKNKKETIPGELQSYLDTIKEKIGSWTFAKTYASWDKMSFANIAQTPVNSDNIIIRDIDDKIEELLSIVKSYREENGLSEDGF